MSENDGDRARDDDRTSAQALWQEQEVDRVDLRREAIERRAAAFQRTLRLRNAGEYAAGLVVAGAFGRGLVAAHTPALVRVSCALTLAGCAFVLAYLRRHGGAARAAPPLDASTQEHLALHRAELERQRDLLASAGRWYVAPLVPGAVLFVVGTALDAPRPTPWLWLVNAGVLLVVLGVFYGVVRLNQRGAARLQKEIDELG